jgi:hypothetical protein
MSQSDFHRAVEVFLPSLGLLTSTDLHLNPMDLPCSHSILWLHAGGKNPGGLPLHSPLLCTGMLPSLRAKRSATSTTFISRLCPLTNAPAYSLSVYASPCPFPDPTQDSIPGCWLGFTKATIAGGCSLCACKAQRSSNRTGPIRASGSRTRRHAFAHGRLRVRVGR